MYTFHCECRLTRGFCCSISARHDLLIVGRFNSKLSDVLEPQSQLSDTKMNSRIQSVYSVFVVSEIWIVSCCSGNLLANWYSIPPTVLSSVHLSLMLIIESFVASAGKHWQIRGRQFLGAWAAWPPLKVAQRV